MILTIFIGLFYSCEKDNITETNQKSEKSIVKHKILDKELIEEFSKYLKDNLKVKNNITFNTNTIYKVALDEDSPAMLVVNQVGFDKNNSVNYGFGVGIKDNGEFGKSFIVKTTKISDSIAEIQYYDNKFNSIFSIQLNSATKSVTLSKSYNDQYKRKSCGQATMDCMTDAYSNHGWISIWTSLQSVVLPETAFAIAGACAIKNC